jgi:hypothetical protein
MGYRIGISAMNRGHAEAVAVIEAMVNAYAPAKPRDPVYWGASSRSSAAQAILVVKGRLKIDLSHKIAIGDLLNKHWPSLTRDQRIDALKAAVDDFFGDIPF